MIKVENFDDVSVQVVERLRVHESLVDILLETTDVKSVVENLPKIGGDRRSQRGALCAQGVRYVAIHGCMEKAMHIATLLLRHLSSENEEVAFFQTRLRQVENLVESVRNQLIQATGICGETDRYERAVTQWRVGVERQNAKTEVRRLEEGVEQTDDEAMVRLKAQIMGRQVFEEGW